MDTNTKKNVIFINDKDRYDTYLQFIKNSSKVTDYDKKIVIKNLKNFIARNTADFIIVDELDTVIHSFAQTLREKEIFSNNLKECMAKRNLNVTDLATKLDLPYSTVNDWYNAISMPRYARLNLLAEALGVTKRYLTEPHSNTKQANNILPILENISADTFTDTVDNALDYAEIPKQWLKGGKEFFALSLTSDTMAPKYNIRRRYHI